MNRRQRFPLRVRRSQFSGRRGSNPRGSRSRRLLLEVLEPRRLLDAGVWFPDEFSSARGTGGTVPGEDVSGAGSLPASLPDLASEPPAYAASQILVKLRDDPTPVLPPKVLRGPATALVQANAFYPLSDVLIAAGAESAAAVASSLAQAPVQTGRWPALTEGEAEQAQEQGEAGQRAELGRWYRLDLPAGANVEAALAALGGMAEVEAAEPNYEWHLADGPEIPPVIEGLPDGTTDPNYGDQWFHANAKIPNAWDYLNRNGVYPGGRHEVVVAVIDSGVDATHPDLAANVWVNPGEIPGNGIDDDGNGFKDDIHGCSVVSNTSMHSGDSSDYHGHGTHVAGIIAAQAFNQRGGVGVAFNVQIMSVRAAQYSGVLTVQDISEGILYAVDNGAEVINMSFGGYVESQLVEDALAVALNQAVLVAAAGNEGGAQAFPANLPYVLGVAASTPDGKLAWFSNSGDIMAPGESIFSTLPGNQYAEWSGTSMAAPMVSGVAALMRSYYWQQDIWSSRCIMGAIAATGTLNAYQALTELPKPGVSVSQTWLFDQASIQAGNDGDGAIDSGERIHLGVEFFNRSGQADHVIAILEAYEPGAVQADPYVTIEYNTVILQGIGPFAFDDNGLIYDSQGVIIGVEAPFEFTVAPNCPNDHIIHFVMTVYFEDAWDPQHPIYEAVSEFEYIVQRGQNLPSVISEDMVLTADHLWIVGSPVLVQPGVTLRIEEGTEVQWGMISSDPYNPGPKSGALTVRGKLIAEGTAERPITLYPNYLVSSQRVSITAESGGTATLAYVNIRNPYLIGISVIDHCYIDRDAYDNVVRATTISNTALHRISGAGDITAAYYDTVLFDANARSPSFSTSRLDRRLRNSVFLQDNENNVVNGVVFPITTHPFQIGFSSDGYSFGVGLGDCYTYGDKTYALLYQSTSNRQLQSLQVAELVANYFGGHVASINDQQEQDLLLNWLIALGYASQGWGGGSFAIGLTDEGHAGDYTWLDGTPLTYTKWYTGYPVAHQASERQVVIFAQLSQQNPSYTSWRNSYEKSFGDPHFILELPGQWTDAELHAARDSGELLTYVRQRYLGDTRYNAFTSKYWDPAVSHWMRYSSILFDYFDSSAGYGYSAAYDNYWGTTSTTLIDYAITDFNDNFNTPTIDYGVPPAHGFESTYPFVESVDIDGTPAETVPLIGAGPATFRITFNRDMDTTIQPFVAFGPSPPHTDFRVHPLGGNDAGYNANTVSFSVTLSQPASQPIEVDYTTADGTAIGGIDYRSSQGTLTFPPGETEQIISIPILGDTAEEMDETFFVVLSNPRLATLEDDRAQGTLVDDDPQLAIDDVATVEGDSGTSQALFTVTLSAACQDTVTVDYETLRDTAVAEIDYQAVGGTLTFPPGERQQTIAVPVLGNTRSENDRQFTVKLTHPTRASIADNEGRGTILDDDPWISIADVSMVEGQSGTTEMVFTIRLSAAPRKTVTVPYRSVDRSAVAGEDYQAVSGTLTFAAGPTAEQTVTVPVLGDTAEELTEHFAVLLHDAQGGTILGGEAKGTIVADDGLLLAIDDQVLTEGDGGRLSWSGYVGASLADSGYGVAVDVAGNAYVVGKTASSGWGFGGYDSTYNGGEDDAFVAKFAADGQLLWSTYLGGDQSDYAFDVAVDAAGNAWVVGRTKSPYWIWGGFDTSYDGDYDAFVAKLGPDGQLLWSTYLGGVGTDYGTEIALDDAGNVWVTGTTASAGWATGGYDTTHNGGLDAFLVKIAGNGELSWSTYLGGAGDDYGEGVAVGSGGNAWVTGYTRSSGWVSGGYDTSFGGGWCDGFVAAVNNDGQAQWSTYLGWDGDDYAFGITVDGPGNGWVAGRTSSNGWISGGFDTVRDGENECYLVKLAPNGQRLWSTYLGTPWDDVATSVGIDADGNAWVAGYTESSGFAYGGFDSSYGGGTWDAFVTKIAGDGTRMLWSSLLGGAGSDTGQDLALDVFGNAWVVGVTDSTGWVSGGFDTTYNGQTDGFLAKVRDDGIALGQFTVSLSQDPASAVTVDFATVDDSAKAGTDYVATSGRLTFQPGGPVQQTVPVLLIGNETQEPDETFLVRLNNPVGAIISLTQGQATIVNDDPLVSVDDVTVTEGDSEAMDAVFTVTLSVDHSDTVTVDYATADGSADAGADYTAVGGTLTFAPHEIQKTIVVPVLSDSADERSETFTVTLSAPCGATISDGQGHGTIQDNDPTLSIADVSVVEGDNGTTEAVFTVSLSGTPLERVTVRYETLDGTATAGEDYLATSGTLIFEPWSATQQTVAVPIVGDGLDELDETFTLRLSRATYATLVRDSGQATIGDDDPRISISDVKTVEGNSGTVDAVFSVRLSAAASYPVTVDYATADGTATAGVDYQAQSGTLTFAPGGAAEQTVTVPVSGDDLAETNETFFVNLSTATNAVLADAQGQGTIVGDDGPLVSIADVNLLEGDSGTKYAQFTVSLSAAVGENVAVQYSTADGVAKAGSDYSSTSGTLIFAAGGSLEQTFLVPVLGDAVHEGDETFYVNLLSATVVGIADDQATATIVCDDPVLSIGDASLEEGLSGNPLMTFTVTISQDPVDAVQVNFTTANNTAAVGVDYLLSSGVLTFSPGGLLAQSVEVYLISDGLNEIDETFFVNLSGAVNAEIGNAQGVGTITDDDGPKILVDDVTVVEGNDATVDAVFTVRLSEPTTGTITVQCDAVKGTAAEGSDYQATTRTLTFEAGQALQQTVSVPVIGDTIDETDETFTLRLSNASGAPIADSEGVATITDDDAATLSISDATVPEGYNGWINNRTWQGTFWVTPMTGESYHLMRISGAVAADDPWLVSGYDVGRFRFQIKTLGVAALTLQATGQEGSIRLSWAQDDFDLLAGYNLYRATTAGGTYTRLNSTIIPVGSEWFVDTNVTPAVPMYYKFTVVQTDMTESGFSNVATAAALDTIPPVITHTPKTSAAPGAGLRLTATVTDNVGVEGVAVRYRPLGSTQAYVSLAMINISGTSWSATIPGTAVQPPGVDYYLTATDGLNTVYHGTAAAPHSVLVSAAPSLTSVSPNQGAVEGGLRVTLSGTQFQAGATVDFGGVPATDVVVQTSSQILCTTPAHFPALVDVRVVNPDASQATLLNGFRYADDDAVLSLPTMSADHGAIVEIPISLAQVDGLRAGKLTVNFDAAVLRVLGVSTGTLTSGWALEANTATAGRVILSLAGTTPSSGNGTLAKLNVEAVGAVASQTALTFSDVLLNDGAIEADLSNGLFAVNGFFTLSGSVKYFQASRAVPGAELELVGVGAQSATSDASGAYSFPTVQTGAYTLTPGKADQVVDITAYDASLILQAEAGLMSLTANQRLAADVNRNGAVTAMDASYVLEKSVGLLPGVFPGAGCSWLFSPAERSYPLLSGNRANQDFTAILLGDVSGNWDGVSGGGGEGEGGKGEGEPGEPVVLTLPDVQGQTGGTVAMPLQIALGDAEVHALDLRLSYDSAQLSLLSVTAGAAADGVAWAANTIQTGVIRIGMASSSALSEDGDLLSFSFQVNGSLATPAAVSFQFASVDEGAVEAALDSGFVADTLPPALSSLAPATGAAGVALQPQLSITFKEAIRKGSGAVVLRQASDHTVVETMDVAGAGVSVAGATATIIPTVTLRVLRDYYVEVTAGAFEDLAGNDFAGLVGAAAWNFTTQTLRVTGSEPTASGLVATFNGPMEASVLNLYDGSGGTLGPADLVVLDGAGKAVAGSLVVGADLRNVQWVATGSVLPPGTYTVSLKSGSRAFRDGDGHTLDGDANGTSGGDFGTQFTVAASGNRVVSLPDLARGAGQSVNIPNTASGLPIRLDNAEGVMSLAVDLVYGPALLSITAATLAAGIPADWTVALDTGTAGVAKIIASGTTALSGTNVEVVRLTAAVPSAAAYGAIQAIRLENVSLNSRAIAAIGDVAVHKAAYLGDADGSGVHSSADAFLTVQAALGLASGFAAHAWTDPRIVGDADGSGVLSAADAFLMVQEGLELSEPFVPDNPRITVTPVGGGVDPQFRIDVNLPASAGSLVSVPVHLAIDPTATNVGAWDFDLFFDPAQLTIQLPDGVAVGADTASGWAASSTLVAAGHLRVGMLSSRGRPLAAGLREIARLQFHVAASAASAVLRRWEEDRLKPALRTLTALDLEPVDPGAGGYAWTALDGSIAIAATGAGQRVGNPVEHPGDGLHDQLFADPEMGFLPLQGMLTDLADDIVSAWSHNPTVRWQGPGAAPGASPG